MHIQQNLQQNLQQAVFVQSDPEVVAGVVAKAAQALRQVQSEAQAEVHRVQLNAAAYAAEANARDQQLEREQRELRATAENFLGRAQDELRSVRAERAAQQAAQQQETLAQQQEAAAQQRRAAERDSAVQARVRELESTILMQERARLAA
jgi:hypothetical protein